MARLFPPLQRGVLTAAERNGALLVALENLYGYGPTGGRPMTEDLPLAATTVKGRTRAAMTAELLDAADAGRVRIAIGRASDFFGAGVTQGSTLGERVFGNALAGRRADFIGNPDLPHTYSYVPDIAAGLATLGTDDRAAGQVRHLPGPQTVTTRALLDLVAGEVGHPVAIRSVPKIAMRALGLVNPMLRELAEMAYEFDEPFVLDTSKYESAFGAAGHPAGRGHRCDRRLVPDPAEHAMTTEPEAASAMTTEPVAASAMPAQPNLTAAKPDAMSAADLTPAAAWSRRVRRIGGLIQAAFAAFWLARASLAIGGRTGDVLLAVSGVAVIGVFTYAIRVTAGTSPGQRGRKLGRSSGRSLSPPLSNWSRPSCCPSSSSLSATPTGSCRPS